MKSFLIQPLPFKRRFLPMLLVGTLIASGLAGAGQPQVASAVSRSTIAFAGQVEAPSFNGGQSGNNGLFMDPAGQYLYGVTFGYILKINLSSFTSESQVDLSSNSYGYIGPEVTTTSSDGSKAYVAGTADTGLYVRTITTATGVAEPTTHQLTSNRNMYPQDIAVANVPNVGPVAYVMTSGWGFYNTQPTLYILNLTTGAVNPVGLVALGFLQGQQSWVATSADGTKAYLSPPSSGIKVMDTETNIVSRTILGAGGLVATSKTGNIVYSIPSSNTLKIMDTAVNDTSTDIPLSGSARSISIATNGDVAVGMAQSKVEFWDASAALLITTAIPNTQNDANSIGIHIDENGTFGRCIFTSDNWSGTFTAFSIDGSDCGPFGKRFSNGSTELKIGSSASINIAPPGNGAREAQWVAIAVFKDETRIRLIQPPFSGQVITQYADAEGGIGLTYRAYNAANLAASNVSSLDSINYNTQYRETYSLPIEYKPFQTDKVSSGNGFSCALSAGIVWCWGTNSDGQLGDGTTTSKLFSTKVDDGLDGFTNSNITDVIVGSNHTCAIKTGSTWCWGTNSDGQLGDGTTTSSSTPVKVDDVTNGFTNSNITSVALSRGATCAVSISKVYCWGSDSDGRLGNDTGSSSGTPTAVVDVAGGFTNGNVTQVFAGRGHFCAISNGIIHCWGNNDDGQLGDNTRVDSQVPALVQDVNNGFTNISVSLVGAGDEHTCAISVGVLYCWGENGDGQLGDGTSSRRITAVKVIDVANGFTNTNVTHVKAGEEHTCAITAGVVFCWGYNDEGQLGDGTDDDREEPVKVIDVADGFTNANVTQISAGDEFSCAVYNSGLYCWGDGSSGRLGNGTTQDSDTAVAVCCDRTVSRNSTTNDNQPPSANTPSANTPSANTPSAKSDSSPTKSPDKFLLKTDSRLYKTLPRRASDYSSFKVLTNREAINWDIVSTTPGTCTGTRTDLVTLGEGKCIARIVVERTRRVIRTLSTRVVDIDVSVLKVGNETYVQSPIFFSNGSRLIKRDSSKAISTVAALANQASSIVVAGHTGSLFGNDLSNKILATNRAQSVVNQLRARRVTRPFAIAAVGDDDPVTIKRSQTAQDKNRRVVVVLVP